jgi:two-component system phosphate regulon sensor histidine kinase PhoR
LKNLDLIPVLQETTEQFKQTDFGQKSEIEFQFNEIQTTILADKFHFSHLVLNILENAVKYCDKNPSIQINLNEKRKNFELSFTDNGIGISKDQRKKIFKKFYRVPTGNVHNVKGFGLGLDYVKKITMAHKWKIKVDENPKGGSIFTLSIPNKK